jgi:phenylalanyl-tRNA synthetase beta chain
MKLSELWLRDWVFSREKAAGLADRLTLAGIEVASIAPVTLLTGEVVVGEIVSMTPHPQADRLRVCQVNIGQKQLITIVCGAPNAAIGLKVPAALTGAVLPNGMTIKATTIRGVESSGMLCSAAELGLEESSEGLLVLDPSAKPGASLRKTLKLDDQILEIELTPNRGDCLSVMGLAREVAALGSARFIPVSIKPVKAKSRRRLETKLSAKSACARYTGRVIEGLRPDCPTPWWLKERLRRSGVRSIHPVVDVTNYVMLELGQPMHAFDLDRLSGGLQIRHARSGETLTLLDGQNLALNSADLVIADHKRPVALAGIMGGMDTSVGAQTINLFLESAWFRPEIIALRAREYGLHSESSHRFERGVDPNLQRMALERATALILSICGGQAGPVMEVKSAAHLPRQSAIRLRADRITRVLGMNLAASTVETILKRLGMRVAKAAVVQGRRGWKVSPPSWRSDIVREEDLIEELARVHGYDKVPVHVPRARLHVRALPETRITESRLRSALVDREYQEAITYSFVDPAVQTLIAPGTQAVSLINPIASDLAQMRTTLWPGLIQTVRHNLNRQQTRVRLFEIGHRFLVAANGKPLEQSVVAGVACGSARAEQWGLKPRPVDFFDVKADVEALLAQTRGHYAFKVASHPALHPGQSAEIFSVDKDISIGLMGVIHPEVQEKIGLDHSVILFEINAEILGSTLLPEFHEISRFPAIRRDLALLLADSVPAQAVFDAVQVAAGSLLVNLELFDEYRGEGIDSGRKSLALGLTFQDTSRTLNDEEIETVVGRVVTALQAGFGAQLRQ